MIIEWLDSQWEIKDAAFVTEGPAKILAEMDPYIPWSSNVEPDPTLSFALDFIARHGGRIVERDPFPEPNGPIAFNADLTMVKHLPGRHNQQSHGRGGSSGRFQSRAEFQNMLDNAQLLNPGESVGLGSRGARWVSVVTDDDEIIKGVWKPWERPFSATELAVGELDEAGEFNVAPLSGAFEGGTFMKFVEGETFVKNPKDLANHMATNPDGQKIAAMDFLTGNMDRHDLNIIRQGDKTFAIDNDFSFGGGHFFPELTPHSGIALGPEAMTSVNKLTRADLRKFAQSLPAKEIADRFGRFGTSVDPNTYASWLERHMWKRLEFMKNQSGIPSRFDVVEAGL